MYNLLSNEHSIPLLPVLASKVGINEAIFLQQLHYWTQRSNHLHEGHIWVYNTYESWHQQFPFWSINTIQSIVKKLESENLIVVEDYYRFGPDDRKWYRVNYEVLGEK